jgi:tetratricopeptide (TPR) repeat protein
LPLLAEPGNRDALLGLAAVETRAARYASADEIYRRLLDADPRDAHAHAGLLALRAQQVDPVAAESRLKGLIAAGAGESVLYFTLGNQYAQQRRWPEAHQAYARAATIDPENPDFAYNLAVSLEHLRQPQAALGQYRRALALGLQRTVELRSRGRPVARAAARALTHADARGLRAFSIMHWMNSPTNPQAKRHIGQILIDQGILTEDQLRIALLEQTKTKAPVGRLLVQLGFVSEATLRDALSEKLGLQSVDLAHIIVDPAALKMLPRDMARRYRMFPVALDRQMNRFIVALADTNNIVAVDQLRAHLKGGLEIELRLAGDSEIERAVEHYYGHEFSIDGILREIETGEVDYATIAEGDEYTQPVVRLVSALLSDAVERGASDIHFEPEQNFLRIRYRIDGVLRQIRSLHKTYWPAMAVRLKVMSKMNIAETRAPQDGRISLTLSGRGSTSASPACRPRTARTSCCASSTGRRASCRWTSSAGGRALELLKRMIARPRASSWSPARPAAARRRRCTRSSTTSTPTASTS